LDFAQLLRARLWAILTALYAKFLVQYQIATYTYVVRILFSEILWLGARVDKVGPHAVV